MKATALKRRKYQLPDGSVIQIMVWELPYPTPERPHVLKYRLNYSLPDGTTVVRFDNEVGKGDHKHVRGIEYSYKCESLEKLLIDFRKEVREQGGKV